MPETDLILLFTRPIEQAGLKYFITGSMAGMIYGEPRLTMDVDLVLVLPQASIRVLHQAFHADEFYCPPVEVMQQEVARPAGGHFNFIHHETGFKADIYLAAGDLLHAWALKKRREIKLEGDSIWVAPPEYVITRKLEYYREGHSEKHFRDIHAMIERSADEIDETLLMSWIRERGLSDVWKSLDAWRSM